MDIRSDHAASLKQQAELTVNQLQAFEDTFKERIAELEKADQRYSEDDGKKASARIIQKALYPVLGYEERLNFAERAPFWALNLQKAPKTHEDLLNAKVKFMETVKAEVEYCRERPQNDQFWNVSITLQEADALYDAALKTTERSRGK